MKKIVITFIAVLMGLVGIQAQNTINKTTPEGDCIFKSEYIKCYDNNGTKDESPFEISLSCTRRGNELSWFLNICVLDHNYDPIRLPEDGRMLIKLYNGEIIELKQVLRDSWTQYRNGYNIPLGGWKGQFSITEDEIKRIASHTVIKVRVEMISYEKGYKYYMDYQKTKISEAVKTEYNEVSKAVKMGDDYIYSDF